MLFRSRASPSPASSAPSPSSASPALYSTNSIVKNAIPPLRLSDLQWRCSICGLDYQDGATELLLLVACPELLLPVVRPDLLLQAMPTSPLPSRSSSSSASTAGVLGGGGADGRMGPSSSRTTIAEQSRKLVSESIRFTSMMDGGICQMVRLLVLQRQ